MEIDKISKFPILLHLWKEGTDLTCTKLSLLASHSNVRSIKLEES